MDMRSPTLLVIEASSDQALLFAAAARRARAGLAVHTAADGLEGIAYLAGLPPFDDRRAHPVPELILLDPILTDVDGFEVLSWIRDRAPELDIPVVVLTASPSIRDTKRFQALGAREVHRKPDDPAELNQLVRSIVDRWIRAGEMIGAHIWAMG
jgi:CheY-like chemotaxis protein